MSFSPKLFRRGLSLHPSKRAVCWPKPDYDPMEVQRSELKNGIKVAAARHSGTQMGACTVMYQAGSRYESLESLGASHFIRACSDGSGCAYTAYSKTRFLQQHGAYMTCSTDRQTVCYTLTCVPTLFPELKYYLLDTAARNCFNHWEIDDRRQLIKDDLHRITPQQRLLDLIQRASWAGPLSNSVFCEEELIDEMSENTLNCFAQKNMTTDVCTVGSVGLPFEETLKLAEKINFSREKPKPREKKLSWPRGGFEYYDMGSKADTWIAVAIPGCGTKDLACLMKHAIIAAACGTGDIQAGQHELDRAPQPPLGYLAGKDVFTNYRAFNISYDDNGIFGILAKTRACSATDVAFAAANFLKSIKELNFEQIEIGRNRLCLSLARMEENAALVAENFAMQSANSVQMDTVKNAFAVIDGISVDEISLVARNMVNKCSMMSYAVVGDIGAVPNDCELLCAC